MRISQFFLAFFAVLESLAVVWILRQKLTEDRAWVADNKIMLVALTILILLTGTDEFQAHASITIALSTCAFYFLQMNRIADWSRKRTLVAFVSLVALLGLVSGLLDLIVL